MLSSISPPAAMAICSSIASGMIALTGIVFSLAFVMVQFSATAYSPRLVLWVARDPVVAHALGVFSATFLYGLMMLGWIDRDSLGRVPLLSIWFVLVLLLASMGMFIALIDRIGMLQVSSMLIFTGNRGRDAINELYHETGRTTCARGAVDLGSREVLETFEHQGSPRVIQAFDIPRLVSLAAEADVLLESTAAVGDTVLEGTTLLRVHGRSGARIRGAVLELIEMGHERTFAQDPNYALRLVVDIAIKALSPAGQ